MTSAAAPVADAWRIMTWNLHGSARPDLGLVAHVLDRANPDVVALQEVRRRQAQQVATTLGWHVEWVFKHNPYTLLMWWRAEGLAVLSPWPLDDVWRTTLSSGERRRSHGRRVAIGTTVRRDLDAVRLFDTHLATGDPQARLAQARRLVDRIAHEAPPAAVVAGDLNARDELEVLETFAPVGLVDPGGANTSPAVAPVQRIDYVLVPGSAAVVDRRTPDGGPAWAKVSDHLPTLVELRLPELAERRG